MVPCPQPTARQLTCPTTHTSTPLTHPHRQCPLPQPPFPHPPSHPPLLGTLHLHLPTTPTSRPHPHACLLPTPSHLTLLQAWACPQLATHLHLSHLGDSHPCPHLSPHLACLQSGPWGAQPG